MSDRTDIDAGFAQLTRKVMRNGEVRTRVRLPEGPAVIITQMPAWEWGRGNAPWQEAHRHEGLTEIYLVLRGWMVYIDSVVPAGYTPRLVTTHGMVIAYPKTPHLILLGPESVIQTTTVGEPVPNPERAGNDWWPVTTQYDDIIKRFNASDYQRLREACSRNLVGNSED